MGSLKMQGVVVVSMLKIVAGDRLAGDVLHEKLVRCRKEGKLLRESGDAEAC